MKLRLFILLPIMAILGSCNKHQNMTRTYYVENFINYYLIPDQIDLKRDFSQAILYGSFVGQTTLTSGVGDNHSESKDNVVKFKQIASGFGDTSYNQKMQIISSPKALGERFSSIKIVSEHDFDVAHPAGASLNDIFILHIYSYGGYVSSGYTASEKRVKISKLCSEITAEDLRLITTDFELEPTVKPQANNSLWQNIEVTFSGEQRSMIGKALIKF